MNFGLNRHIFCDKMMTHWLIIGLIQMLYLLNSSGQQNKETAVTNKIQSTSGNIHNNKTLIICKYILVLNIIQTRSTKNKFHLIVSH